MSFFSEGTCNAISGSAVIQFNTASVANMSAGDIFRILSDEVFYEIASTDGSNDTATLTSKYSNSSYQTFVVDESIATGDGSSEYNFTLNNTPVIPNTIEISDADDVETFTDNGDGTLTGDNGGSGTIAYLDGTGTLSFGSNITIGKNILADEYQYGSTLNSTRYQIARDFTDHYSFPEPYPGVESPELTTRRAIRNIDSRIYINTKESHSFHIKDSDTAVEVADGKEAFTIPDYMDTWKLLDVIASVYSKGVTGTTDIQVRRRRAGSDQNLLSAEVTIGDEFYATDGTVDSTYEVVQVGDQIYVDVEAIHTTPPNGLDVTLIFQES